MIFLIDYDRGTGSIRLFKAFQDRDRLKAEKIRLELELLDRIDAEIVLLEADSEETVRKTHARYFNTATELLRAEQVTIGACPSPST
jgi:hypothetical protein